MLSCQTKYDKLPIFFTATQTTFQLNFLSDQWKTSKKAEIAGFKSTYFEKNANINTKTNLQEFFDWLHTKF